LQDVFSVQDRMADRVVEALRPQLAPAERAVVARGVRTRDPDAYQLYLAGRRAMYTVTRAGVERAIGLFEQALARDSNYADAWVGMADAYSFYSQVGGIAPVDVAAKWRRAASHAIELDSLSGYAYAMRGMVRALYDWDWEGARSDYRRGLMLEPSSAEASIYYAQFLFIMNEFDSALVHVRRAVRLDPMNAFYHANLAGAHLLRGSIDSAEAIAQKALELDSAQWVGSFILAMARQSAGRDSAAAQAAGRMSAIVGDSQPLGLAWLANYYGRAGRRDDARRVRTTLEDLSRTQHVQATHLGAARLAAGDREGALDALEEARRNHDLDLPPDLAFPHGPYRELVGDARYEEVVRQVFGALAGRLGPAGVGRKR
jgi:tetratricopeptide (TPR) repeat protein